MEYRLDVAPTALLSLSVLERSHGCRDETLRCGFVRDYRAAFLAAVSLAFLALALVHTRTRTPVHQHMAVLGAADAHDGNHTDETSARTDERLTTVSVLPCLTIVSRRSKGRTRKGQDATCPREQTEAIDRGETCDMLRLPASVPKTDVACGTPSARTRCSVRTRAVVGEEGTWQYTRFGEKVPSTVTGNAPIDLVAATVVVACLRAHVAIRERYPFTSRIDHSTRGGAVRTFSEPRLGSNAAYRIALLPNRRRAPETEWFEAVVGHDPYLTFAAPLCFVERLPSAGAGDRGWQGPECAASGCRLMATYATYATTVVATAYGNGSSSEAVRERPTTSHVAAAVRKRVKNDRSEPNSYSCLA